MWEAIDRMKEFGIPANSHTYSLIISRYLFSENLEMALQFLFDMKARNLRPEVKAVEGVITLATQLGFPRLALDLVSFFEKGSTRRLSTEVWMRCLIAS